MTNKVFENLTVIEYFDDNKYGHPLWICQCVCGNKTITTGSALRSGATRSCGCLRALDKCFRQMLLAALRNEGEQFEGFIVIKRKFETKKSSTAKWICQCKCGEIIERSGTHLRKVKKCLKCFAKNRPRKSQQPFG